MQRGKLIESDAESEQALDEDAVAIEAILEVLRNRAAVDFSQYKPATIYRRIAERVGLHKLDGLASYIAKLKTDPGEVEALYHDILVNVTSFFRNPEAYDALRAEVLPALTTDRPPDCPLRIWTLGCSSGEEAYSLAMAVTEYLEDADLSFALQVTATDVNAASIDRARRGIYRWNSVGHIPEARRARFFSRADGGYRVTQALRDTCVFTRHDVLADAQFTDFDLVSCQNVLIYLDVEAQQKVISILHAALRPNGFLWLGSAESIGPHSDLFELRNGRFKFFQKQGHAVIGGALPHDAVIEPDKTSEWELRSANEELRAANADLSNIMDAMEQSRKAARASEDAVKAIEGELRSEGGSDGRR